MKTYVFDQHSQCENVISRSPLLSITNRSITDRSSSVTWSGTEHLKRTWISGKAFYVLNAVFFSTPLNAETVSQPDMACNIRSPHEASVTRLLDIVCAGN